MTIRELLDRVLPSSPAYDPIFARQFKALVKRVSRDRERLRTARSGDFRSATKFFDSWKEFIDVFADDPRSLAALTLPRIQIKGAPACGGLGDLFPEGTTPPTLKLFLYFLEPGADQERIKHQLAPTRPARAKKAKATKKR